MSTRLKLNLCHLCRILSLSLLFSSAIPNAFAEEVDYYNFPTGEQEGGGVRGESVASCNNASYPVPLIPQDSQSLTTSASPNLFFDTSNIQQATTFDFLLLDRNNQVVYQDVLKTNNNLGLIGLELADADNANELQLNNAYHWYLVQQCEDFAEPKIVANGSLKRIELEDKLAHKITDASATDKVNIYQESNIWYEAVEHLTQLKCNTSNTEEVERQLAQIAEIADISVEALNNSLDNYCAANLKI